MMDVPLMPGCASDEYGYHEDVAPVSWRIPGSPDGHTLIPLRTSAAVEAALYRDYRDTSTIHPDDSVLGIGRESRYGLFRLDAADTRRVRAIINPIFSPTAVGRWDQALSAAARARADALARASVDGGDLVIGYVTPLLADMVRITAGLDERQWEVLQDLVGRADGLITMPADHAVVDGARCQFRDFAGELTRERRAGPELGDLVSQCAEAMQLHLPDDQVLPPLMNVLAGFPSAGPAAFASLLLEILAQDDEILATCRSLDTTQDAVREALRLVAPFTCLVPGKLTEPIHAGKLTIPRGALVIPVIRAAYRDPEYAGPEPEAFRLGRPRRLVLAFGAGTHRCPAYSLMMRFFTIAVMAIVEAGIRLAVPADEVPLGPVGLMRQPEKIPVTRVGALRGPKSGWLESNRDPMEHRAGHNRPRGTSGRRAAGGPGPYQPG
jgi:cytochrome P450